MRGILGKKVGMTQVYREDGRLVPVTVIEAGPCWVIQKKSADRDGYEAVQIGFDPVKEKRVPKARLGHLKKASVGALRHLREIRGPIPEDLEVGQEFRVDIFSAGDEVQVTGVSKGKGFAGGVKRHGYRGGRSTHGSMFHRAPGSIGASSYPSRVFKGKKMPGHMGCERTTVKNLTVLRVDRDQNLLLIQGAVPGSRGGMVMITGPDREGSKN